MQLIDVDICYYHGDNDCRTLRREVYGVNYVKISRASLQGWGPSSHASWACVKDVKKYFYYAYQDRSMPYRLFLYPMDEKEIEKRNQGWDVVSGYPTEDEILGFEDAEEER